MNKSFKYSLCALAVSSVGFSQLTFAQQADAQAQQVERIEVTGSRIKRNDLEGAAPIDVINRDEIAKSGFSNLQQLLERTPVPSLPGVIIRTQRQMAARLSVYAALVQMLLWCLSTADV